MTYNIETNEQTMKQATTDLENCIKAQTRKSSTTMTAYLRGTKSINPERKGRYGGRQPRI